MTHPQPSFTVGIEEEYLLVDRKTRDLAVDVPPDLVEECGKRLEEGQVTPEFLQSQIEVGTSVCPNITIASEELAKLRRLVADEAVGQPFASGHQGEGTEGGVDGPLTVHRASFRVGSSVRHRSAAA